MLIPVRCFTCGKVIGDKWEAFQSIVKETQIRQESSDDTDDTDGVTETPKLVALKALQLNRMCCRRHFLTNLHIVDTL